MRKPSQGTDAVESKAEEPAKEPAASTKEAASGMPQPEPTQDPLLPEDVSLPAASEMPPRVIMKVAASNYGQGLRDSNIPCL